MSNIIPFKFNTAEIRTLQINGEPMFIAKDVADILGYSNSRKAIKDHCKGVTKCYTPTSSGEQELNVIPERDVYRLIMRSKLPDAEKFEDWVVSEVLPSIRKTGTYKPDARVPQSFAESLRLNADLVEKLEQAQPKIAFAEAVNQSINSVTIQDFAKAVGTGQNRFYALLRENGYLMAGGSTNNKPYQRYVDQGLFKVQEGIWRNQAGEPNTYFKTLVTGKGQQYFQAKFFDAKAAQGVNTMNYRSSYRHNATIVILDITFAVEFYYSPACRDEDYDFVLNEFTPLDCDLPNEAVCHIEESCADWIFQECMKSMGEQAA